jgi:hypothetical protein
MRLPRGGGWRMAPMASASHQCRKLGASGGSRRSTTYKEDNMKIEKDRLSFGIDKEKGTCGNWRREQTRMYLLPFTFFGIASTNFMYCFLFGEKDIY